MENKSVELEPQKNPPEVVPAPTTDQPKAVEETVVLSKAEMDDLKHKAEVSSQNFERAKKAEEKLREFEGKDIIINDEPSDEPDEDKEKLKQEVSDIKKKLLVSEVKEAHPELKGLWNEFEKFHEDPENSGMGLKTAAKAFLIEMGLLEPKRKGLEKPTGGPKTPVQSGMTVEEIKKLRETNYKVYRDKVKKGLIKQA